MLYVIIGCLVVLLAIVCYFAFFKKNKNFANYKIQDAEKDKEEENVNLQLNEETESGLALEDDLGLNLEEKNDEKKSGAILSDADYDELDEMVKNYKNAVKSNYNPFEGFEDFNEFDFAQQEDDDGVKRSEIVSEIHKMSPKMKAIVLGDVLDRKYF